MPRSTGWRTDPNPHPVASGTPVYMGTTTVSAGSEAGVRSATTTTALVGAGVDTDMTLLSGVYSYSQGFAAIDFDPVINPADLDVAYAPQIPWFDPDTSRPDWLGNTTGVPSKGVVWEFTHGLLATDQDATFDSITLTESGFNKPTNTLPLDVWQVGSGVVFHDGLGWHATSVAFDGTAAAFAAASYGYSVTKTPIPGNPGAEWFVTHREAWPLTALRVGNTVALAYSLSPDPTVVYEAAFDSQVAAGGGSPNFATVYYYSPRYRLLFADVPLRQFPRDDYLGGAPRQGGLSTSVQASTRQGWIGTYR